MEHDLVLEGRVVTPGGVIDTEVGVSEGVIREIRPGLKGSRRIAAEGCLIFPGFIDIHVHLREPGWERKEGFRTGSSAAVHGGVTTVVDMPNNPKPADNPEALELKARLARAKSIIDVMFLGGIPPARPEELAKTSRLVAGYKLFLSETTGSVPLPDRDLDRVLRLVAATGKPLSVHCEDQALIDQLRMRRSGDSGPESYADSRPPEAEVRSVKSVSSALGKVSGLTVNICHASAAGTLDLVRQGAAAGRSLRCEAALHHLYFTRRALEDNPLLRTNPPLRGEDDRAALVAGLKDGTVSFLVTDHAPHLEEEKLSEGLAGVPGLDDYSHLVSWLLKAQGVDPMNLARVAASNPAKHLGMADRGEIRPGLRGDFAVVDLHAPEKVSDEDVRSRCGWSPYRGREFPGRARWVVTKGEVLMDDFEQVS